MVNLAGFVAWMKRSVIRECDAPFFPDSAALHPGYNCIAQYRPKPDKLEPNK